MSDAELISFALEVRLRAYAPYSGFAVGAALLADDGRVFSGCNVENISYGLTICAERVAIGSAVQGGARRFLKLAIASASMQPIVPCGACRQVLAEFAPDLVIVASTITGLIQYFELRHLLPLSAQGILK